MNRYHHKDHATYCYRDKKTLITDLCEEMQKTRKEYLEHKKNSVVLGTHIGLIRKSSYLWANILNGGTFKLTLMKCLQLQNVLQTLECRMEK